MLSMFILWEEPGCEGMTLNSFLLCQVSGRGAAGGNGGAQRQGPVGNDGGQGQGAAGRVHSHQRSRRSWVWNQFFILEEYTGDEPLYVGKVQIYIFR